MERPFKIILIAILALISIQLIINLFVISPNLKNSLQKLEASQRELENARKLVMESKLRIDSIQTNVLKFNNYLITIQGQTEVLYQERALREAQFRTQRDSILRDIKQMKLKLDSVQLPELEIYDTNRPNQ
jgi:hypothetical protein